MPSRSTGGKTLMWSGTRSPTRNLISTRRCWWRCWELLRRTDTISWKAVVPLASEARKPRKKSAKHKPVRIIICLGRNTPRKPSKK
ncbi:hypothetical protein FR483_n392R [Paramecium bursaria Chlorella virus FR483]|uniref:Uncharacterized protein n392R n=1 Tax=Paramecium bursaria Chlorella virus FR483 TaxID=399781 RepID=A7J796_PBCVF|nr:hypothetical protein FR483_n392R [Paramecium bursaria Chlorella virus FR483]ABT15677.1 hypothetical protein FR483_n392R [Paramecium bursaria Chlorella virus FR483]